MPRHSPRAARVPSQSTRTRPYRYISTRYLMTGSLRAARNALNSPSLLVSAYTGSMLAGAPSVTYTIPSPRSSHTP